MVTSKHVDWPIIVFPLSVSARVFCVPPVPMICIIRPDCSSIIILLILRFLFELQPDSINIITDVLFVSDVTLSGYMLYARSVSVSAICTIVK